jgi:hypothetical protein
MTRNDAEWRGMTPEWRWNFLNFWKNISVILRHSASFCVILRHSSVIPRFSEWRGLMLEYILWLKMYSRVIQRHSASFCVIPASFWDSQNDAEWREWRRMTRNDAKKFFILDVFPRHSGVIPRHSGVISRHSRVIPCTIEWRRNTFLIFYKKRAI